MFVDMVGVTELKHREGASVAVMIPMIHRLVW